MYSKKILVAVALVWSAIAGSGIVAPQQVRAQSSACTTIKPGPDWICVNGGWYPPNMPLPGTPPASSAPPPVSSTCTTVKPGPDWICAGGGWLPPGMSLPRDTPPPLPAPVPGSTACTTVQPGPDWVCSGGGWYPPNMAPPGGEPPVTSSAPPEALPRATGGQLRVMTWNIHFGHGDPWGQAVEIANSGADVVMLQEASTFDEYMPSTYPARLRQLTGHQWYSVWAPHGGRYTDNEGTLILSRLPVVDRSTMNSTERGFARAVVSVGGVLVTILNAHLDWDTGMRSAQLAAFLSWGQQFGGPRLAGGDFNAWWGEWWIRQMETAYSDTWQDVTGSDEYGYTLNHAVRFDYLFRSYDGNWRVIPTGCWVQNTTLSDHAPVIADYIVR